MNKRIPFTLAAVMASVAVLAVAGCGSSSNSDSSTSDTSGSAPAAGYGAPASTGTTPATSAATTIDTAKNPDLGTILVDSKGNTLYLFKKDKGGKSSCYGACAVAWPPVATTGDAKAGSGVQASLLGTTTRTDGSTQVTYNDWPLYLYQGDSKPGDTNGNDFSQFGAQWYAVTPAGDQAGN